MLDRGQESLAKGLGEGHRVVRGVAGSGKTLILTYRARLLARAFPDQTVLVTCHNRSLAGMLLQRQLHYPNVRVRRLDGLLSKARRSAGRGHGLRCDTEGAAGPGVARRARR